DANATVPAANAPQHAANERRHSPAVEVPPLSGRLEVVDSRLGLAAPRANRRRTRWRELRHDAVLGPFHVGDAPALGHRCRPESEPLRRWCGSTSLAEIANGRSAVTVTDQHQRDQVALSDEGQKGKSSSGSVSDSWSAARTAAR